MTLSVCFRCGVAMYGCDTAPLITPLSGWPLAGLASWQVFTIYILHHDDLQFVDLYSPLSQPLMISFYLLTIICTVSVCDRSLDM